MVGSAPLKVSPETDLILTEASHYFGRTKKDLVDLAVREYVENHRAELTTAVRASLSRLDGTLPSLVSEITGLTRAELDELGGFDDGGQR
jgi:hypothetical protein